MRLQEYCAAGVSPPPVDGKTSPNGICLRYMDIELKTAKIPDDLAAGMLDGRWSV